MTIQKLPLEIIQKIFEHIRRDKLDECLYICKAWHPVIKSIYYKEVTWSSERIQLLKDTLAKTNETGDMLQLMPMTKRLHIHFDLDYESEYVNNQYTSLTTQLTEGEFILLLSHFPNLECLDIMHSTHKRFYMNALINCREHEKLPPIEEFNMENFNGASTDPDFSRLEFALCYRFRHSLKNMTVSYIKDLANGSTFLGALPDFPTLRCLDVMNDIDPNLTLFHLLRACPNLSSLAYTSTFPTPANTKEQLNIMLRESEGRPSFLKNLTKIKLTLPTIATPYIDFFAEHCPQTLDEVDLEIRDTDLYTWIDTLSLNVALKFCENLQKFSTVRMRFDNATRGRVNLEANSTPTFALQGTDSKIHTFYQILDTLTKKRELKIYTAIYNSRKEAEEIFNITNGPGVMHQFRLDGSDYNAPTPYYSPEAHSFGGSIYPNYALPVPSSPASLEQLAKLKNFMVLTGPAQFDRLPNNFLDFVKSYCPDLKNFQIHFNSWRCRLKTMCKDPFRSSIENTTHVLMEGAQSSQALFDSLVERFPRMENLSFGIDTSLDIYNEKIKFNLSKLTRLDTFTIDIEGLMVMACDPIFIQFRYTGSKRTVQYLLKKVPAQGYAGCGYEFEPVSAAYLQEAVDTDEMRRTYVIYVEGLPQLASIQIKALHSPTSTLDLSHVSSVMLNDLSSETK